MSGIDRVSQIDSVTGNPIEQKSTNNAGWVTDKTGPQGAFPANITLPITILSNLAALGTSTGLQGLHSGHFRAVSTAGVETLSITALDDSGNNIGPVLLESCNTGSVGTVILSDAIGAVTTTAKQYKFKSPLTCSGLVFTKSAAVETFTINGFLSGVS